VPAVAVLVLAALILRATVNMVVYKIFWYNILKMEKNNYE
jgi:hypothetical protein